MSTSKRTLLTAAVSAISLTALAACSSTGDGGSAVDTEAMVVEYDDLVPAFTGNWMPIDTERDVQLSDLDADADSCTFGSELLHDVELLTAGGDQRSSAVFANPDRGATVVVDLQDEQQDLSVLDRWVNECEVTTDADGQTQVVAQLLADPSNTAGFDEVAAWSIESVGDGAQGTQVTFVGTRDGLTAAVSYQFAGPVNDQAITQADAFWDSQSTKISRLI